MSEVKKYPRFFVDSETDRAWENMGVLYVKVAKPGGYADFYYKDKVSTDVCGEFALEQYIKNGKVRELPIEEAVLAFNL